MYKKFISNVQRNLHVVFTMNPANPDLSNRTASSPALFNRCVIDWFGDWSEEGLFQVAKEFTKFLDVSDTTFSDNVNKDENKDEIKKDLIVKSIVSIHKYVKDCNQRLMISQKKFNYITPRDFLDFINHLVDTYSSKKEELLDLQNHLNSGLNKLRSTEDEVMKMQTSLDEKQKILEKKQNEANEKLHLMVQKQSEAE